MEASYTDFRCYDFENDVNFQSGLKTMNLTSDEKQENILKMQIFYYNRFIQPIDLEGYQQWLAETHQPVQSACELELLKACSSLRIHDEPRQDTDGHPETQPLELSTGEFPTQHKSGNHSQGLNELSPLAEDRRLSFAEVFQLIQSGKEVPGLQKLNISPCGQRPTASQMSRRPKPWESKP